MSWVSDRIEDMNFTELLKEKKQKTIRIIECMVDAGYTIEQCQGWFVDLDSFKEGKTGLEFSLACLNEYLGEGVHNV